MNKTKQQPDRLNNRKEQPCTKATPLSSAHSSPESILLLNFAHPLTEQQRKQFELLTGTSISDVITIPAQINEAEPLGPQITTLIDATDLSVDEWNQRNILINLPGYAPAAALLLAEIHGRTGHFPTILRLRPKHGSVTSYETAEIINLQTFRDKARVVGNTPTIPVHTFKA